MRGIANNVSLGVAILKSRLLDFLNWNAVASGVMSNAPTSKVNETYAKSVINNWKKKLDLRTKEYDESIVYIHHQFVFFCISQPNPVIGSHYITHLKLE